MRVKKILNNNVVITKGRHGEELIVMGKGLAFGLKPGSRIDSQKVDKTFTLKDESEMSRFEEIVKEIPPEIYEFAEECIDCAQKELGKELHTSVYITLTDHINTMMERAQLQIYPTNPMLWDIRRMYSEEFKASQKIVDMINTRYGFIYDDNEAASIALHLVNAELEMNIQDTIQLTKVITEILGIVKYHFRIVYDEDSLSYYRFIIHLRFFAKRLFTQSFYDDIKEEDFSDFILSQYKEEYECVQKIKNHVKNLYQYDLTEEETMYLTFHIAKVVRDSQKV